MHNIYWPEQDWDLDFWYYIPLKRQYIYNNNYFLSNHVPSFDESCFPFTCYNRMLLRIQRTINWKVIQILVSWRYDVVS